jgi:tol-pal system protein YbgF
MMEVARNFTNRRGRLLAPIACMALMPFLAACATKGDIRMLRNDIASLQSRQDSAYRASIRQMREQADSVRALSELLRTTRGQLTNQIRQLQEMTTTLQELLGQTQQRITQLKEQGERAQLPTQTVAPPITDNPAAADDLYRAAAGKLQEGSAAAARVAFEQFLSQYPQHERAADAQLGLAETYVLDDALADAVTQFVRVSEAYPASARAPEALYRAGEMSERLKRTADARKYYNQIVNRYANSPSASLAKRRLAALR